MRKLITIILVLCLVFIVYAEAYDIENASFSSIYEAVFSFFESVGSITTTIYDFFKDCATALFGFIEDTLDVFENVYNWVCEKLGITDNPMGDGFRGGR